MPCFRLHVAARFTPGVSFAFTVFTFSDLIFCRLVCPIQYFCGWKLGYRADIPARLQLAADLCFYLRDRKPSANLTKVTTVRPRLQIFKVIALA